MTKICARLLSERGMLKYSPQLTHHNRRLYISIAMQQMCLRCLENMRCILQGVKVSRMWPSYAVSNHGECTYRFQWQSHVSQVPKGLRARSPSHLWKLVLINRVPPLRAKRHVGNRIVVIAMFVEARVTRINCLRQRRVCSRDPD